MGSADALRSQRRNLSGETRKKVRTYRVDLDPLNPAAKCFQPDFAGPIDVEIGHILSAEERREWRQGALQVHAARVGAHRPTLEKSRSFATNTETLAPALTVKVRWTRSPPMAGATWFATGSA